MQIWNRILFSLAASALLMGLLGSCCIGKLLDDDEYEPDWLLQDQQENGAGTGE